MFCRLVEHFCFKVFPKKYFGNFYFSFLLLQKRNKKGARQSITARLAETAMCSSCTTVASTSVTLLLDGKCKPIQKEVFKKTYWPRGHAYGGIAIHPDSYRD